MPAKILYELVREPAYFQGETMNEPTVSFICPTHGRAARQPHLINEMFYWYTRQTYRAKQLLILNDAEDQSLFVPNDVKEQHNVHVVNYPYKIRSLGEKMNLLVMMAAGSICLVQEDDDISLPWRAEQAVAALHNAEYWTPGYWWYAQEGEPWRADARGVGHNCAAYRRSAMYNRYPHITKNHDGAAHGWALGYLKVNPRRLRPGEEAQIPYVYRWGVSDLHLSGQHDMDRAYDTASAGPPGLYRLEPVMGRDYLAMHNAAVSAQPSEVT